MEIQSHPSKEIKTDGVDELETSMGTSEVEIDECTKWGKCETQWQHVNFRDPPPPPKKKKTAEPVSNERQNNKTATKKKGDNKKKK